MKTSLFFKSNGHKARFVEALRKIGHWHEDGRIEEEFGSVLLLLTSDEGFWESEATYIDWNDEFIDVAKLVNRGYLSTGERVLTQLAAHCWEFDKYQFDLSGLRGLDGQNFEVAMSAIRLRHASYSVPALVEVEQTANTRTKDVGNGN